MVVARQRPHTAKGFVFILLEDETGMMNAIVRPDIYERDRVAIRGEPFLWIKGRLARDDGAVNIIAEEVRALQARRRPLTVPAAPPNPYALLKDLRRSAPSSKDWG